ncbi:MAG: hypothetical protein JEZ07_15585 [Phycisphaerae bacterium]|nr:hypothetical protein [Phycisphaerae bacterium]
MISINRREMLGITAGMAVASTGLLSGCQMIGKEQTVKTDNFKKLKNADFYDAQGNLLADKAAQAYYEMMRYHNYPVYDVLKTEEFWAIDFGLKNFSECGMAGIFWCNDYEDRYFGHEIYLLPGQMIVEHRHMKTEKAGPKMEAWQVRHGSIWTFGEGEESPEFAKLCPPIHKNIAKARNVTELKPGMLNKLDVAETWHFMLAGPEGAIVTEYANYHDNDGLRFQHPDAILG